MLRIDNAVTAEGQNFHSPFYGDIRHVRQIPAAMGALTTFEVTTGGFLKPGVPFGAATAAALDAAVAAGTARTLLTAAGYVVEGVTFEAQKVAKSNVAGDLTAAGTVQIVIGTVGVVSRKRIEEMLGRVLTASELAGFVATSQSHVSLAR